MQLIGLSVTNFRSLAHVRDIPIRKQTILTGHNDCGKTATLDALAFLLGERDIKESDISHFAIGEAGRSALPPLGDDEQPRAVVVEGKFEISAAETELLNASSPVRIRRRFAEGEGVHLEWEGRVPQSSELRDLHALKVLELRQLASNLGLTLSSGQPNVRASWLEVLEAHATTGPQVTDWVAAPAELKDALPQLLYFKGDSAESPEAVVRSILTAKLREYTLDETTRQKITDLEEEFSDQLKEDADQLRKLVKERCAFDEFTLEPQIQFKPSVSNVSLAASARGQHPVPLSAAGAGRSRRITLALWEASQQLLSETTENSAGGGVIIVYDEPDTHLDYDHQRRVMEMIKASARGTHSTVVVATHSLNLIDGVDIQDIVHLNSRDGRAYIQSLGGDDTDVETRRFLSNMATSLGFRNSVLLHEKCFIAVEGATEYAALPALFKLAFGYPIQSAGIALWSCGGNDGALNFAKFLKEHHRTVKFLVDADSLRDKNKEFNLDRLKRQGFTEGDCLFIGAPNELEDVFGNDQWADTMNALWPRDDELQWKAEEVSALRTEGKFSKNLHTLVYKHSSQAPRSKEDMVVALTHRLRVPSDVPASLVSTFETAMKIATTAGQSYWSEDD
ncbi:ATP-dependent endonuclease [Streptomyces sp. NBC_00347]|uniref:ATP-dependent nuclease n=1 Tax=Streptomyces sp. NBC_00347 TaxID=2975721 RepID=UPI002251E1A4|nr:AAA family ATPase [Streptomyces sp. NBC_00347]MCX5124641.1 AAA family ATPase [Streptomyces sp. NBC_00347]